MTLEEIRAGRTPGEWTLRKPIECDNPLVRYWLDGPQGVPIADIKANGHFEANAALLALAPAMLDAVDALRIVVRELTQDPDHGLKGAPVFYALSAARAALAKLEVTP